MSAPVVVGLAAGVSAVAALADWWSVAPADPSALRSRHAVERVAKPLVMVGLVVAVVATGALESTAGTWLVVGLVFGLVGDVALLGRSEPRFQAGLSAFLVGHAAFLAAFLAIGTDPLDSPWSVGGLVVLVVAVVAGRRVVPRAKEAGGPALASAVALYMVVIGVMLVAGWATESVWIALGASVFVASDTVLARDRFVLPGRWAHLAVMVTYHLGQALIVVGVLTA